MITRRDLLATAALGVTACGFDAAQAQEPDTSPAELPRIEVLTDNEVRTYLLVFRTGQEVMKGLLGFARVHGVVAGHVTGIGALSDVVIGHFDPATKAYTSNVAPFYHVHVGLGRRGGQAGGGHLFEATVRPTVEVVVTTYAKAMRRQADPDWGLPLLAAR